MENENLISEEKVFTQQDVDRIVQDRVARVKREIPDDYEDLKGTVEELNALGYKGSAKEVREAVRAVRESQYTYQEAVEQVSESGEIPDDKVLEALARKFGTTTDKVEKAIKKSIANDEVEETKRANDEAWNIQVEAFNAKYENVDLDKLAVNPKFQKFVKGKSLPLKELYEDFVDFVGETEAEAIAKAMSKSERSTGNGKGSSNESGGYGLTAKQIELAKENGMTSKEYAESLKLIRK